MEPFKSIVSSLQQPASGTAEPEQILRKLGQNPRIRRFVDQNPKIEREQWLKNITKLYQFAEEWSACDHCPGLDRCPNMLHGFRPRLLNDQGHPALSFTACPLTEEHKAKQRQSRLISSYYIPKDILQASFKAVDKLEPGRQSALKAAGDFVKGYLENPEAVKGLYLCGEFGVGKTYLMGAIMNRLAESRHIASLIVYTPDFFHEIKSAIQDNTVDRKLDVLKKTPLLILDDIGAETMTPWIRDEVLGSLMQYRMMEHLPTLYTSNFNYDELEEHFAYSQKSGVEYVKARRLMERIRHFTTLVEMGGTNRR